MDSQAAPTDALDERGREVCCSVTAVLVRLVRGHGGEQAVAELLARSHSTREPAYLENADNWVSQKETYALFTVGAQLTGDPRFAKRVGEETVNQHQGKQVATLLRSLGSVEAVMQAVAHTAGKLTITSEMAAVEVKPGRATINAIAREGFKRTIQNCELTTGLLTNTPSLFGLPPAHVEQSECAARGDHQCLYTITWDAEQAATAADPQQRVTSLEAQLLATSERLHSVYAIASDLVSSEDLDTVLRRIVERAADAVRAPSHILAVRPDPDAELQVYSRGIDDQEAQTLARATLAGEQPSGDSMLVVDVSSVRRTYGQLIARYKGAIEFFPQERDMLGLYAKHAAAVLDMALALQESARRHEQVSSLLSLAHALAKAGTSLEVAERLATAAPEVVDCDRVSIYLWDQFENCLRFTALWARDDDADVPDLTGRTISPDETPSLKRQLTEPEPHFFTSDTDDVYVRALMRSLEVVGLVVVPIVARDMFLGILTAAVTERPERLRSEEDLIERLTGVAALAAPAIQSGQLVDQLGYKATHDGLTGLLNRVGFRHCIDRALGKVGVFEASESDEPAGEGHEPASDDAGEQRRASDNGPADAESGAGDEGRVGLLFVDLNEFKQVNDTHGHEAGDELIRQAAERLSETCRGEDEVARLGGDEFAIVLAHVQHDEQVRAAEGRVREAFAEPFSIGELTLAVGASVGGGVWPDDGQTATELVRHADAAMYQDKARSRRSTAFGRGRSRRSRAPAGAR
jgi:diguanylate cyclase (GGDEF)-like protein